MVYNPSRMAQGGDVEGTAMYKGSQGNSITVAKPSYDPGYDLDTTLQDCEAYCLMDGYTEDKYLCGEGGISKNDAHYDKRHK